MRRTIAAVGLVGIGLLGPTLPAIGAPDGQVTVCHQTGSETNPEFEIGVNEEAVENGNGGNGNGGNGNGNGLGPGGNGNGVGQAGECSSDTEQPPAEEPPAEEPPAEEPPAEEPPAEVQPPAVVPPVTKPPAAVVPAAPAAKPAAAAPAAAPAAAMPAAVPEATNAGYNVQTAAGGGTESGIPAWLAALTALLTGLSAAVLARGGARARNLRG